MRRTLRTYLVGLCVVSLIANPALACHSCGGGWGGGYRYSAPVYYGPVSYGGYYDGCGGCGGCEVVVSDCCGGCNSCDTSSEPSTTSDHDSKSSIHQREAAPTEAAPPMDFKPTPMQAPPRQPAQVERPIENTPAPQLPATTPPAAVEPEPPLPADETLNPAPPQDDLFNSCRPQRPRRQRARLQLLHRPRNQRLQHLRRRHRPSHRMICLVRHRPLPSRQHLPKRQQRNQRVRQLRRRPHRRPRPTICSALLPKNPPPHQRHLLKLRPRNQPQLKSRPTLLRRRTKKRKRRLTTSLAYRRACFKRRAA